MATLPEGVGLDSVLTYVDQPTKTFLICLLYTSDAADE